MDNRIRAMAETAARLVLQAYQEAHPAWIDDLTPVDAIVSWLGLEVATFHAEDYAPGTYGFIDPDEDESLIWLHRDLHEAFRRFTLAHELGHALLHCNDGSRLYDLSQKMADIALVQGIPNPSRDDPCHDDDVQESMTGLLDEEQFQEALGIGQSYDPRSKREVMANIFAAELLMPLERIRARFLAQHIQPNTLAESFGVSPTAILNRLAGLLKSPTETGPLDSMPDSATQAAPSHQEERPAARKRYDEFQQAAIEAPTPALIVAGPGSGKTSTLIGRTEYSIRERGVPPEQILALTFSRKAAQEMEERLQQVLSSARSLPKVSTFHAYCADLLRQHGTRVGLRRDFALIDEAEGYFLLRQQSHKIRLRHYHKLQSPAYYFPDILKAISRAKDELVSPQDYAALAQRMREQAHNTDAIEAAEKALEVAHVYKLYQEALASRGDTDFGGLIMLTVDLLRRHPEIAHEQQSKYQHILVDEFQDVNRASGVLLRELSGEERHVWVVGDANQAIYGFRGASPANISQFAHDFTGAVVLPLSRNYRSRPDLVALAEAFRCQQLEPGETVGKNQPVRLAHTDTYVTLAQASDEVSELAGLIEDIRRKHASGYAFKDMIVLCRTRAQAQKISRALEVEGFPIVERGGMLEQDAIKDALSIILLLAENSGMGILRMARQPAHPLSQRDIETLLLYAHEQKISPRMLLLSGEMPPGISPSGQQALLRLMEILQTLQRAPDLWTLLAQYLFLETSCVRDLLANAEQKQKSLLLADYDRLLQLARHYDQQQHLYVMQTEHALEEDFTLEERAKGFLEYLSLLVLLRQDGGNRQSSEENAEEQANIIRVMTVHASKGLEFPVVYMPGLVQRRFPLQARSSPVTAPTGMLPEESVGSAAHESGEACLFYVGVTRARDHLVLSYSERYGKIKYKRSPYLDPLEAGVASERLTRLHWDFRPAESASPETPATEQALTTTSQPGEDFIAAMQAPRLSASAIEAYVRCPRQYAYSNIYHFTGEADTYQLFWQATQKTLQVLRQNMQEQLPTQQQIQELYTRHWQELGGHTAPFAPIYEEHGHEVVEAMRRKLSTQESMDWETRPGFDVDISGKKVYVTVDRIEASYQSNQPMKFVRTRFGRSKSKPTADIRELFYTLASQQLHPGEPVELQSHNMSTGEIVPITMTARKAQSLYDDVEQAIEGLERNDYPALPTEPFRCPTCPFFLICPA